jgi:hypothetical protein
MGLGRQPKAIRRLDPGGKVSKEQNHGQCRASLTMFRALIFLNMAIAFARDYVSRSGADSAFVFIYSIFVVELLSDLITKLYINRLFNIKFKNSPYFNPTVVCGIFAISMVVWAAGNAALLFGYATVSGLSNEIFALVPVVCIARYLSNCLLLRNKQFLYYILEFSRNILLFVAFQWGSVHLVVASYAAWGVLIIWYFARIRHENKSIFSISVKKLYIYSKVDVLIAFQSLIMFIFYTVDKQIVPQSADEAVILLLLNKLTFTLINLIKQSILIPMHLHINNAKSGQSSNTYRKFHLALWGTAAMAFSSVAILFGYLAPKLPIHLARQPIFTCLLAGAFVVSFVYREYIIRLLTISNNFKYLGRITTITAASYCLMLIPASQWGLEVYLALVTIANLSIFRFAAKKTFRKTYGAHS